MGIKEILESFVMNLLMLISYIGGIDSSMIYRPILIVLSDFSESQATSQTTLLIFTYAFVKYLVSFWQKNPDIKHKPLIDYNIVVVLLPLVVYCESIGVIINEI